jgi:crenactin
MTLPKEFSVFGEDYGTSEFKFGVATLGNTPDAIDSRGYFPDMRSALLNLNARSGKEISSGRDGQLLIVGPPVAQHLEARRDIAERMVYPMRNGEIESDDERAWLVVKEITRYGLLRHAPEKSVAPEFNGFKCVAALAATAPRYMYDRLIKIHKEINSEEGRVLTRALSIIPQPLAVAISQKRLACTVLEGGHGNTQVAPVSSGVIFGAQITLNRGGSDCDLIAAEILRDAGYSDLAHEPKLVKVFKETLGLVPKNLSKIMQEKNSALFESVFKIPSTKISIDLGKNSWQRFLIGEYFFNPNHEIFASYYRRGFPRPADTFSEGKAVLGTTDLADVIIQSVQKCSFEIQPALYQNIILSGGNFAWHVPPNLTNYAVNSPTKLKKMLEDKGIIGSTVELTKNPVYNVWQGCVAYGLYIPENYEWDWDTREGWLQLVASAEPSTEQDISPEI